MTALWITGAGKWLMNNTELLWDEFQKHLGYEKEEALKIADFCLKNCGEMMKLVMETADETAENTFLFRLPWDMEATSEVVHFDRKIKWNYVLNEDEEFIFQLNRHRYWISLGQAYRLTGNEKYVKAFIGQLLDWIDENIDIEKADKSIWRTLETGLRADYWVRAMVLFADSPLITEDVKKRFFEALLVHAGHLATNPKKGFSMKSNWGVMEYTGLYILSLVLDNEEYKKTAIYFLKMGLHTQIHDDGFQWEASPMYHNEVLAAYLEVLRVAEIYGDKPFTEDEREIVKRMAYSTLVRTYPNHHQLMTGDSDDTDVRDLLSQSAIIFKNSGLKSAGYERLDFEGAWLFGTKGIETYEKLETTELIGGLQISDEGGEAIWRSSYNEDADFIYFRNGCLGGGHGHQDKLHIELWFEGEQILRDSGRYTYKHVEERYELKGSKVHNVPIVNNLEYAPSADSWIYEKLPLSVGNYFKQKDGFLLLEGAHCGYMEAGVLLRRRVVALKPDIIVICDEIIGNKKNELSQHFAFAEDIDLKREGQEVKGKGVKCEFVVKSFDERGEVAQDIVTAKVSRHYNHIGESKALRLSTKSSHFLTTIIVKNQAGEKTVINKEKVYNLTNETVLKDDEVQGYLISRGEKEYSVILYKDDVGNGRDLNGIKGVYGLGQTMAASLHKKPEYMTVLRW